MFDRFLSAFSVISRIPVRRPFRFDPSRMDFYLPVIGIFPAFLGLLCFTILRRFFGSVSLSVVCVLIVQYLCFNLFHLDGLMDTADAFLGSADRDKRLAILKDSRIGVYGFFAGAAALGLKAALLAASAPFASSGAAVFIFAYPLCGRFGAALVPRMAPPVNPGSLGALAKESSARRCAGGMITALLLWAFTGGGLACLAGAAGLVPGAGGAFAPADTAAEMAGAAAPVPAAAGLAAAVFLLCPL
ncbi:MAG: adenosylcobinamide-GDP ribazoletransferase, partial [Treponema sp.]|nr:adenosylcobinamide-GDP ribazoletransferase [Treponema sp.]